MGDEVVVPIDLDPSLQNFDVEDVGSCSKTWAQVQVEKVPDGRASHSATMLDQFRFVVIGGGTCSPAGQWTHFADAHIFDVREQAWHEVDTASGASGENFPPRRGHVAAKGSGDEVLVFGGTAGGTGQRGTLNDCWGLDIAKSRWRRVAQRGSVPSPRRGAVGWVAKDHFFVVGGYIASDSGLDSKIYGLNLKTESWSVISTIGANLHFFPALSAGVTFGSDFLIVGGDYVDIEPRDSINILQLRVAEAANVAGADSASAMQVSLKEYVMRGSLPCSRFCLGAAPIANRWLVVFGGTGTVSNDVATAGCTMSDCYLLDLRSCAGSIVREQPCAISRCVAPAGRAGLIPSERNGFTMVSIGTKCIVFGGGVYAQKYFDETWVLELSLRPNVAIPSDGLGAIVGVDLEWLRESPNGIALSDVALIAGATRFPAHRAILCARSEYFRALLAGGFREASAGGQEIDISDVNPDAFELALGYIYTGQLAVPEPSSAEADPAHLDAELLAGARQGDREQVLKALCAGADPNVRDYETGCTALHICASQALCTEDVSAGIAEVLAAVGADLSAKDLKGRTPLQLAASTKRSKVARALVSGLQGSADAARIPDLEKYLETDADEEINARIKEVLRVLDCADRLGLSHLSLLCEHWLALAIRSSNVLELLEVADSFGCMQLKLVCMHFLKRQPRRLKCDDFSSLPQHLQDEVGWACRSL